jgi:hypothetical protein
LAAGTVDLTQSTINMPANPEIAAGPEVKGGANALAGLSVLVRIEGPLDRPSIRPEIREHVRQSRENRKDHHSDRRSVAEKVQGQAGRRGDWPLPRQRPDRPARGERRDAPEIDGNVYLTTNLALKPGNRLMVAVEDSNECDLWASPFGLENGAI